MVDLLKKLFEDFCNLSLLFATSSLFKVEMQQWCLLCFKRKKKNPPPQPSLITEKPFVWSGLQNALSDSVLCSKLRPTCIYVSINNLLLWKQNWSCHWIDKRKCNPEGGKYKVIDRCLLLMIFFFIGNIEPALDYYTFGFKG